MIPILAFNPAGKIDVILMNDTQEVALKLGLDQNSRIDLSELAMTNMLFHISQTPLPGEHIPIIPGESTEKDKKLLAHVRTFISDNILNPKDVIEEIIQAWDR